LDDDNGTNSGSAYIYDLDGNNEIKITASDGAAYDFFSEVAIGCGRIVVGVRNDDDNGSSSGSVYIYDLDGTQLAKITSSDAAASDFFGFSVAVGCGRIVVGAPGDDDNGAGSGSVYIYDLDGNNEIKITASDGARLDGFGHSVAVGCGRIVVGADGDEDNGSDSGSAYIYDLNGNELSKITAFDGAANDNFGYSVAVGCGRIVVGAPFNDGNGDNYGAAYIYDLDGNLMTLDKRYRAFAGKLKSTFGYVRGHFGYSVAVGCGRVVVGAPEDSITTSSGVADSGVVYTFETPEIYTVYDLIDMEYGS
jgi:hypothetical protein